MTGAGWAEKQETVHGIVSWEAHPLLPRQRKGDLGELHIPSLWGPLLSKTDRSIGPSSGHPVPGHLASGRAGRQGGVDLGPRLLAIRQVRNSLTRVGKIVQQPRWGEWREAGAEGQHLIFPESRILWRLGPASLSQTPPDLHPCR